MDMPEKEVRIKTGVLKRILKEKFMYEKEYDSLQSKLTQYKQSKDQDSYAIKRQEEILKETAAMIPDSVRRLTAAYEDLKKYIPTECPEEPSELYLSARNALQEASPFVLTD